MANSAFDGSGNFVRSYDFTDDRDAGIKIQAGRMDEELDGIATGLSTCILKDGTQTITANIPWGGFKITGLGAGSAAGDSVRYEQVVLLSAAANQTITRSAAGTVLTLESTDAGAASGPDLVLHRNSASPADNDILGSLLFNGEDDGGAATSYARIQATALDVTDTTEDANLRLAVMVAGALTDILTLNSAGASIGTSLALTAGTIELGHASDTTLARVASGRVSIEGVEIVRGNAAGFKLAADATQDEGFTLNPTVDHVIVQDNTDGTWAKFDLDDAVGGAGAGAARGLLNSLGTTKGNILWYNGTNWTVLAPP